MDAPADAPAGMLAALLQATYNLSLRVARAKVRELGWFEFEEALDYAARPDAAESNINDARRLSAALYSRARDAAAAAYSARTSTHSPPTGVYSAHSSPAGMYSAHSYPTYTGDGRLYGDNV